MTTKYQRNDGNQTSGVRRMQWLKRKVVWIQLAACAAKSLFHHTADFLVKGWNQNVDWMGGKHEAGAVGQELIDAGAEIDEGTI